MRKTIAILLFVFPIMMGAACDQNTPGPANEAQDTTTENTDNMSDTVIIKIGANELLRPFWTIRQPVHLRQCFH